MPTDPHFRDLDPSELQALTAAHERIYQANSPTYSGPSCATCKNDQPPPCTTRRLIAMYERLSTRLPPA